MEIIKSTIGQNILQKLSHVGLNITQLARRLDTTYTTVWQVTRDKRPPSEALLHNIAGVLGTTFEELLGDNDLHKKGRNKIPKAITPNGKIVIKKISGYISMADLLKVSGDQFHSKQLYKRVINNLGLAQRLEFDKWLQSVIKHNES